MYMYLRLIRLPRHLCTHVLQHNPLLPGCLHGFLGVPHLPVALIQGFASMNHPCISSHSYLVAWQHARTSLLGFLNIARPPSVPSRYLMITASLCSGCTDLAGVSCPDVAAFRVLTCHPIALADSFHLCMAVTGSPCPCLAVLSLRDPC